MKDPKNIQIADLVKAMAVSEPCLFNNSSANLMPVIVKEPSTRQRDWVDCELNPEYVETVIKRIKDVTTT